MDVALLQLGGTTQVVHVIRVAAVDHRVSRLKMRRELRHDRVDDCGRHHEPDGSRSIELRGELFERGRSRVHVRVERLHVVPGDLEPLGHIAAHPPETDHSELHQMSSNLTRTILRPRSSSEAKSPAACARISRRKPNLRPGIETSPPGSSTTWTKRPVSGPPLCNWPVEWRYRGPRPCVTTQPVWCARSISGSSSASRAGSMNAWIAM